MPKVFVTQETNVDFGKAEEFGDLVFLTDGRRDDFHNIAKSQHNERLIAHLRQGLQDFDGLKDWLVITGSPYVCAAMFALLGMLGHTKLRILRWDNRDHRYIPLSLDINK